MSIGKKIPETFTSTGQGFTLNVNTLQNIRGVFLTKKDFVIPDLENLQTYINNGFTNGDLVPLHYVEDIEPKNQEAVYKTSQLDYTYQIKPGKYRHVLKFDWNLTYYQIVAEYSGTDVNVIYYDGINNIILTKDGDTYRGLSTSRIVLEKHPAFGNGTEMLYDELDIELADTKELTLYGKEVKVDWFPRTIDKLFIQINIGYVSSNSINFSATYQSEIIDDITNADVTVSDDTNGDLQFSLFNRQEGEYQLAGFSDPVTKGCLIVNSSVYLGRQKYFFVIVIDIATEFLLLDDDNFFLLNDEQFNLLTVTRETAVYNSGGAATSDWEPGLNSTPYNWNWYSTRTGQDYSRVTGNGFTNLAQRIEKTGTSGFLIFGEDFSPINPNAFTYEIGKTYRIRLKHRNDQLARFEIRYFEGTAFFRQAETNIPINIGNALSFEVEFTAIKEQNYIVLSSESSISVGAYIEIDEVFILEEI